MTTTLSERVRAGSGKIGEMPALLLAGPELDKLGRFIEAAQAMRNVAAAPVYVARFDAAEAELLAALQVKA
jgi:hypothetical protein